MLSLIEPMKAGHVVPIHKVLLPLVDWLREMRPLRSLGTVQTM